MQSLGSEEEVSDTGSLGDLLGNKDIVLQFQIEIGPAGGVECVLWKIAQMLQNDPLNVKIND